MNPFPRPTVALTALTALFLLGPGAPLRAADDADMAARRTAAEELLTTLHMQQTVDASSKRMFVTADAVADRIEKQPNATPEQIAEAQKLREDLHGLITQGISWDAVKGELIQSYADEFTVADLKEVSAFYHTPVGQKLVEKQPGLTEKLGKTMQQRSRTMIPGIQQRIQAANAKTKPSPSPGATAGSSVVVPPGAPGALPVPPAPPAGTATPPLPPTSVTTEPVAAPTPVVAPSAAPEAKPAVSPEGVTTKPVTPSER